MIVHPIFTLEPPGAEADELVGVWAHALDHQQHTLIASGSRAECEPLYHQLVIAQNEAHDASQRVLCPACAPHDPADCMCELCGRTGLVSPWAAGDWLVG